MNYCIYNNKNIYMTTCNLTGYEQVGEFHEVFGHPLNKEIDKNIFDTNFKLVDFRLNLIEEEMNEFIDACKKQDKIEAIDAIADTLYVVYGACHVFGINYDEIKTVPELIYEIFEPTNIFTDRSSDLNDETTKFTEIVKELRHVCENDKDMTLVAKYLDKIVKQCYTLASLFSVDIDKCFAEVHRSNMTKVCLTEEDAKESVEWYKKNESRYKDPAYRISTNPKYWVIYDKETSKILKSIKFELPNLKQFS